MSLPDELDLHDLTAEEWQVRVTDAIDAASDQDHTTWLVAGGKRIARIAPVDEIPDAVAAWAADAKISASEFMALSADRRRQILDQLAVHPRGERSGRPESNHVVITVQHGSEMAEHDGFPPHTHAIRPNHIWLPRPEG